MCGRPSVQPRISTLSLPLLTTYYITGNNGNNVRIDRGVVENPHELGSRALPEGWSLAEARGNTTSRAPPVPG